MANKKVVSGYVLHIHCHTQSGHEDYAKCFETKEAAVAYVNKERWGGDTYTFRLFELGKEVLLSTETVTEPQPPKLKTRYKAGK